MARKPNYLGLFKTSTVVSSHVERAKTAAIRLMSYTSLNCDFRLSQNLSLMTTEEIYALSISSRHVCELMDIDIRRLNGCSKRLESEDIPDDLFEDNYLNCIGHILHAKDFNTLVYSDYFHNSLNESPFFDTKIIGISTKTDRRASKIVSIFGVSSVFLFEILPLIISKIKDLSSAEGEVFSETDFQNDHDPRNYVFDINALRLLSLLESNRASKKRSRRNLGGEPP